MFNSVILNMQLSDKAIQEYKTIFKEEYGKDLSDSEASDGANRLLGFVDILYEQAVIEAKRKKKLEKEPEGFLLDEGEGPYNCRVCYKSVSGSQAWWDLNGVKCLDCQRNIKEGIIPGEICTNDDLIIKGWKLTSEFGIHPATVRKLRREGRLKGIDLTTKEGIKYHTIYLVKDNAEFLKSYKKERK